MKGNPFRETGWLAAGLLIVGLAIVVIITIFRPGAPGQASATTTLISTASAEATATVVPSPYPGSQDYLTATAAIWQTVVHNEDILNTQFPVTVPTNRPDPILPTGTVENDIYERSSGMKLGLDTQNGWVGYLDGNKVDLYAGALLDDPGQGAVFLFVTIPNSGFLGLILTPTQHGGVRVVGEQNNRLTMISTDGTTYYFDVPARRFVDSLSEVVSSATPPATKTPLIRLSTPQSPYTHPNPYPAPAITGTAIP
jgi:hypothetical protein